DRLGAGVADACGDADVVRRHDHAGQTPRRPGRFHDVQDHGSAGEGSEGFSGESDGGVTRGDYGDDRHAIIGPNSILRQELRQETPDASVWTRPAAAALYALAVVVAAS